MEFRRIWNLTGSLRRGNASKSASSVILIGKNGANTKVETLWRSQPNRKLTGLRVAPRKIGGLIAARGWEIASEGPELSGSDALSADTVPSGRVVLTAL